MDQVAAVLGPGGTLEGELISYERRPGQLAMGRRVAEAIEADERLLVEAGTGTGKTLAYLVPAILSGRKVVVATGTKTLQDQIARLDLPRLGAVLDRPFSFAVMKGLGNYVCRRRFAEHTRQQDLGLDGRSDELARLAAFVDESASGDRAEMTALAEDAPVWREVTAAPELRLGKRCAYYDRCFVTGMRQRALDAQVVVVNHHLFFADLALRSHWPEAQVLPPYEVVIFDEAHQIEEVATELFGLHVSSARLFALARDLGRTSPPPALEGRVASLGRRLQATADALASALRDRLPAPAPGLDEVRVPMPDDLWAARAGQDTPVARYHELDTVLEEAEVLFRRMSETEPLVLGTGAPLPAPSPAEAALFGGLGRRAGALRGELSRMVDGNKRDAVRWISASASQRQPARLAHRRGPGAGGGVRRPPRATDLHLGHAVHPGQRRRCAGRRLRVICASAWGWRTPPARRCFPRRSSTTSRRCCIWRPTCPTPRWRPTRRRPPGGCWSWPGPLAGGRCCCSPASATCACARRCSGAREMPRFPLLVQGERPRHVLLDSLRTNIGSVLLATQGFWEGVDVPGEALSLVAMDRLPFAVPADPLTAARIDHIRESGGDPFASYQLPSAALALKQGFGRLIRSRRDRGVVAILDGRIARRHYGHTLLESLPRSCPRTEDLDEVIRFFA